MLMRRFVERFLSYSALLHAFSKATNSDSMVEWAKHACLEDFQDTTPLSRVNIKPLVDLISFYLQTEFALLYPSNTDGELL